MPEVIADRAWLEGDFLTTVQKRGAAIIDARGSSSAASAANAVVDTVSSLRQATPKGDVTSVAVASGGQYGIAEGLQFGFPVQVAADGSWRVPEGLTHDAFAKERIVATEAELESERAEVRSLGLIP